MALDFPDSPSNGDYYNGFVYDSTSATWRVRGSIENPAGVSATTGSPTITTVGDDTVYQFTGDGSITIGVAGYVHALLVGGGGGGMYAFSTHSGGGGGAGAMFENELLYLPAGTHTVVVGAAGFPGESSELGYYAVAGGGAQGSTADPAGDGGSGMGRGCVRTTDGGNTVVPSQGNDGGNGSAASIHTGGGGSGAGGAGTAGGTSVGGAGGAGLASTITGSSLFYAGGGGGGAQNSGTGGAGGSGIGGGGGTGNGDLGDAASPANRGSGGGGGSGNAGGAGSSGVVIVRVG